MENAFTYRGVSESIASEFQEIRSCIILLSRHAFSRCSFNEALSNESLLLNFYTYLYYYSIFWLLDYWPLKVIKHYVNILSNGQVSL